MYKYKSIVQLWIVFVGLLKLYFIQNPFNSKCGIVSIIIINIPYLVLDLSNGMAFSVFDRACKTSMISSDISLPENKKKNI